MYKNIIFDFFTKKNNIIQEKILNLVFLFLFFMKEEMIFIKRNSDLIFNMENRTFYENIFKSGF